MFTRFGVFPTLRTVTSKRPSSPGARSIDASTSSILTFRFSFMSKSNAHEVVPLSSPDIPVKVNRGPVPSRGAPSITAGTSTHR